MKHVCCECCEIIKHMGYPAYNLVNICASAFFSDSKIFYDTNVDEFCDSVGPVLRYLESWEILVSTEVDINKISIRPNMNLCFLDEFKAELCWCQIFEYKEKYDDLDDDDMEEYDPCNF